MTQPNTIPFRKPATAPAQPTTPAPDPATPQAATPLTLESIQEAISNAVKPIAERVGRFESRFPEQAAQQPQTESEIGDEEFYADPRRAAQQIAERAAAKLYAERGQPAAQVAYRTALQGELARMREADPDMALVDQEFQAYIDKIPPDVLMRDGFETPEGRATGVQMAYWTFLGQQRKLLSERRQAAAETAATEERQRPRVPFSERPAARGARGPVSSKLSDEEKKICAKMGVTEDAYIAEKRAYADGKQTAQEVDV
jgi:hypothetical protein